MSTAPVVSIGTKALQKGLPANVEAEQFVLGSVLLDDALFPEVAGFLDAHDFSIEKHRRIFQRMHDLHKRRKRIEYLTLVDELEGREQLESCNGIAYISSLTDGMPRLSSIDSYIKIVKEKSRLRELIQTCDEAALRALQGGESADQLIADATARLLKLSNGISTKQTPTTAEIAERYPGGIRVLLDPSKGKKGLQTPFVRFNEMTGGLRAGELVIIAGRPSMGKTAFALNIADHLAGKKPDRLGEPIAFFSLEMSEAAVLKRLFCTAARVDSNRYRDGYLNREEHQRLKEALESLLQAKLFIDDRADTTRLEITAKCQRIRAKHGLALITIDYLQLLSAGTKTQNRTQEITEISRSLKLLARELALPVIALSQLSRSPDQRSNNEPLLSDLRDGGSIEQDADVVAFIFREEVYRPDRQDLRGRADLIVKKQRNGPTGRIPLRLEKKYTKFEDEEVSQ